MTKRIKHVTAHVVKQAQAGQKEIIFRMLVTVFEVAAAVLIAISSDLDTPQKVALASAIGAGLSAAVNVIKESGILSVVKGGESDAAH